MSQDVGNNDVCEACGCAGEIGFIIKEGDEVAEVTVYGSSKALIETEFAKYVELAAVRLAMSSLKRVRDDRREHGIICTL